VALAVEELLGRREAAPGGHGGGRGVVGLDVGDHRPDPGVHERVHHRRGGLRGVAAPLPLDTDDPRDLGPSSLLVDGRLHGADRRAGDVPATDDPVQPLLRAVR
jgi:hypothetical protein